jgi:NAD(P)-dependent dehydrogenase (short-subunit alcohol dehydrogenase family)
MASNDKVALVTGAGTGVGRAAALGLLNAGWDVALTGRRKEPLAETAEMGANSGRKALVVPCDIGDPEAVKSLFDEVARAFGRLDLLFNNAGTGAPPMAMEEVSFEQWQTVVAANLTGSFLCAQGAIRMMKAQDPQGGRIINNGSISAHVPRPQAAPYTVTKHAITGLTRQISLDGRPFDIVCCQLDIGNAATPMTKRMAEGVLQPDGSKKPEPTMAVEHVANAVVHMASLPLDANVAFMTVMASKMPFAGRG